MRVAQLSVAQNCAHNIYNPELYMPLLSNHPVQPMNEWIRQHIQNQYFYWTY